MEAELRSQQGLSDGAAAEPIVGKSFGGFEIASRIIGYKDGYATYSTHRMPYVCNLDNEMRKAVSPWGDWLARREKLVKFSGKLRGPLRELRGLPAYILPKGNRDNDVPVVVAVSTIRKR